MLSLEHQNKQISLPEILRKLKDETDVVISAEWVFGLDVDAGDFLRQGHPVSWAQLVKDESLIQKSTAMVENLNENLKKADTKNISATSIIHEGINQLDSLLIKHTRNNQRTAAEIAEAYKERIEQKKSKKEAIHSAYPSIDYYTGGWQGGDIITVGARTGIGKTIVGVQTALAAAITGKTVLFFSLEMSETELWERMIASKAQINTRALDSGELTDEEIIRRTKANEFLATLPIIIDDTAEMTIDTIANASISQSRSKTGLDMIIIDYLQLVTPPVGARTRQEEIAYISRKTKILAKNLDVPIMVLVQLNRKGAEMDESKPPRLDDIRESGAIAMDSSIVLLIHRPDKGDENEQIDEIAQFIIDKNRKGPKRYVQMRCLLEYSIFQDIKALERVKEFGQPTEEYEEVSDSDRQFENMPEAPPDEPPDFQRISQYEDLDDFEEPEAVLRMGVEVDFNDYSEPNFAFDSEEDLFFSEEDSDDFEFGD
jgi:replicative DNA helicase